MKDKGIFISESRKGNDFAGVVEHDGKTMYFYLYDINAEGGKKVISAIHILDGSFDTEQNSIVIKWSGSNNVAGLFIGGILWAAFEIKKMEKFGGDYSATNKPNIPQDIISALD